MSWSEKVEISDNEYIEINVPREAKYCWLLRDCVMFSIEPELEIEGMIYDRATEIESDRMWVMYHFRGEGASTLRKNYGFIKSE